MLLYHCTWTRLVPRIRRQGLRCLQTSNWTRSSNGERYGGGEVYAFESRWDAIRWAAKMDWDHFSATGTGKVSILTLDDSGEWQTDFNDTLTRNTSEGNWLKAYRAIPASAITLVEPLTSDMVRALVARTNQPQEVK